MQSLILQRLVFSTLALTAIFVASSPRPAAADGVVLKAATAPLAPEFTVHGLNGDRVKLSSYRGRPVLLVLWATECPACRQAMPILTICTGVSARAGW